MGMNIKSDRVHALAREAARRTGSTQTSVVEQALTRLLADLDAGRDDQLGRAHAIAADFERRLSDDDRRRLTSPDLYDESGLPR